MFIFIHNHEVDEFAVDFLSQCIFLSFILFVISFIQIMAPPISFNVFDLFLHDFLEKSSTFINVFSKSLTLSYLTKNTEITIKSSLFFITINLFSFLILLSYLGYISKYKILITIYIYLFQIPSSYYIKPGPNLTGYYETSLIKLTKSQRITLSCVVISVSVLALIGNLLTIFVTVKR